MGFAINPAPHQREARAQRPDAWLAGVLAMEILVCRTPDTALAITQLSAYPTGFRVVLSARSRLASLPEQPPELAVRYAGDRPASSVQERGFGGRQRYEAACWVWPLPPPGPVMFVCRWPARAVPESVAAIDAEAILRAAARAVRLWP